MDARNRRRWSLALGILLAAALLWLAVRGVSWREMVTGLRHARPAYLALACAVGSACYFIRSLRWRVLLSAERRIPLVTVFWATMAGYLGNGLLPARAGELLRSVLLGRRAQLSASLVLATALTERIVDAAALAFIGALCLLSLPGRTPALLGAVQPVAALALLGLAGLLIAPHLKGQLLRLPALLPLREPWRGRLAGLLGQFLLGMRALQHPRRAAAFLGFTALVWLVEGLGCMAGARTWGLALTLPQALLLLAAMGLASAVPLTPGYVGVYQVVAVAVLVPLGYARGQALLFVTVAQAAGYAIVLAWGFLGLWRLGLPPAQMRTLEEGAG